MVYIVWVVGLIGRSLAVNVLWRLSMSSNLHIEVNTLGLRRGPGGLGSFEGLSVGKMKRHF